MKVGILTHPLAGNYGGMLQAYALHTVLKNMGFSPFILDRELKNKAGKRARLRDWWLYIRRSIAPCSTHMPLPFMVERKAGLRFQKLKSAGLNIVSLNELEAFRRTHCVRWIVGSDQVWRGIYARWICDLPFFFLDFATEDERRNSLSYAASFGSDEWEGDSNETAQCKQLIQSLKAVSVRENSGISICKEVFGVLAERMPDPTIVLERDYYNRLIDESKTNAPKGDYMATYILDSSGATARLISDVANCVELPVTNLMPVATAKKYSERFPISVPQWLRYVRDCKYLVTDSFHGCVFAIIFNKPFVCLGNTQRGGARFESLLSMYCLENRMLFTPSASAIAECLQKSIAWASINSVTHLERLRAIQFLSNLLSTES